MHGPTLKLHRANEHIVDLKKTFRKRHPFDYILKTDVETGERSTFVERHEPTIERAGIIVGDVIHNLRSALDHAYWDRVGQFATTEAERRGVQFPFAEDRTRLRNAVTKGIAGRVSTTFVDTLLSLEPHGEQGGNWLLYAIHRLDILDKHRLLIPVADFKSLSTDQVKAFIPDFPRGLQNICISGASQDIGWRIDPRSETVRKLARSAKTGKHHQKIPVPVHVVFSLGSPFDVHPLIPTLDLFADVAQKAVTAILDA